MENIMAHAHWVGVAIAIGVSVCVSFFVVFRGKPRA
jgi:hypothetical protein